MIIWVIDLTFYKYENIWLGLMERVICIYTFLDLLYL